MQTMTTTILRRAMVKASSGLPNSTMHARILSGLFPKPVRLGPRSVGWPSHEIDEINKARIAGKSDDEIRFLVSKLEAARTAE
jgi:prophage regulatory protein